VGAKKKSTKDNRIFRFSSVTQAVTTISSILGLIAVAFGVWFYLEKRFAPKDLTNEKLTKIEEVQKKDAERLDYKIWCDREIENQKRIWEILSKYPLGTKDIPSIVVDELNTRLSRKEKIAKILKYYEDKGFKLEGDD
jgi:hypothetical protein